MSYFSGFQSPTISQLFWGVMGETKPQKNLSIIQFHV